MKPTSRIVGSVCAAAALGGTAAVAAAPAHAATPRVIRVIRVVDGDTVQLSNRATVRFLGIDAPERGKCGSTQATAYMRALTLGKPVTLVKGQRTDKDRYGRFLRYVQVGRTDVGLAMIRKGLAVARYDSRDGYGFHPRQVSYIAWDRKTVNPYCRVAPKPAPKAPTSVYFGSCADAKRAGKAPLYRGKPGYRSALDRDGDGVACES